jgi:hypothetical protein
MKKKENNTFATREISSLLDDYVKAAIAHGQATRNGEYQTANRAYETIAGIYRELRSRGLEAQGNLLVLLNHEDVAVRSWAASHALEFAPDKGCPVLEALGQRQDIWRGKATATLKEWKNGTLRFP